MNATNTSKTKAAKFSPNYIPQYTECFVRKTGTRGAWKRHTTYTSVTVPAGTYFTREAEFYVNGETEYFQFSALGYDIIVKESAITYDVIEPAVTEDGYCPKCDGTGMILGFRHVANGVCFWCKGKGKCK